MVEWEKLLSASASTTVGAAQQLKMELFYAHTPSNITDIKKCLQCMSAINIFMTMTINRALDYTKASKGILLRPHYELISLSECISLPVKIMCDLQSDVVITMLPVLGNPPERFASDKRWLLENLLCLLSNAVKFSLHGDVQISVSFIDKLTKRADGTPSSPTSSVHGPRQYLLFEVMDTGEGLSEEAMLTLFNPLKQTQRLTGGTGLVHTGEKSRSSQRRIWSN